jgi:hypothetical protein
VRKTTSARRTKVPFYTITHFQPCSKIILEQQCNNFCFTRPHFVDFEEYHISYEHFREALNPRGKIDTHVMELFIRHFNLIVNIPTTSEPMCTKFAFSQSLTVCLFLLQSLLPELQHFFCTTLVLR